MDSSQLSRHEATTSTAVQRGEQQRPRAAGRQALAPPLVVRFGAFGDIVLLTPLLEALHRRFRQPVDLLGSGAWTSQLLAHDPNVGRIRLVSSRLTPYILCGSQRQAVRWLRARPPGPVYLCENDAKSQWLLDRAGIDRRHVVRAFAWELPATDAVPRLHLHPAEPAECAAWLRARRLDRGPLVLLHPGNRRTFGRGHLGAPGDNKCWPAERWAELALRILAELPGAHLLLCGAASEHGVARDIRRRIGIDGRVHDLTLQLPVRRLLALQARAHSMISVATGPAHAAAALGCPLVVVSGREDRRLWPPRARHGAVEAAGSDGGADRSIADIPVSEVIEAWRRLPGAKVVS